MSVKTVLAPASNDPVELSHISLLPFKLHYNGPAAISTYFGCHSNEDDASQTGAFRGRIVVSNVLTIPQGYKGIICESTEPAAAPAVVQHTAKRAATSELARSTTAKKRKADDNAAKDAAPKKPLMTGVRKSPRKQKVVVKYSLDSDEDGDNDGDFQGEESNAQPVETDDAMQVDSTPAEDDSVAEPKAEEQFATRPPLTATASMQSIPPTPLEEDMPSVRDVKQLRPVATFDRMHVYHADYKGDLGDDCYAKSVNEWLRIAAKIHSY